MNLPNRLTLSRFVLTGVFFVVLAWEFPWHGTVSLVVFAIAGLTDWVDGVMARRHQQITSFGILMDPLADKVLVCSAFIAFVGMGKLPAWVAVVVVCRELAITGLRLLAATKGIVLAAEGYGKHKTISQIVAILAVLVAESYPEWGGAAWRFFQVSAGGHPWIYWLTQAAIWVAILLTIYSGVAYLIKNRDIYLKDS